MIIHERVKNHHSFRTDTNLNSLTMYAKPIQNSCKTTVPGAHKKILNFTQNHRSMKIPFVLNGGMESLRGKIFSCHNYLTKLFTSQTKNLTPCAYSLFKHFSFENKKKTWFLRTGKLYEEVFSANPKEHAIKIFNYDKNDMLPLTKKIN